MPLVPIIVCAAIEPLAIWLRGERGFEGIFRSGSEHKLSLYADDLLLYVSNPTASFPIILHIIEQFKSLSGYKLNLQKSEYLAVKPLADKVPQSLFPFKRVTEGFKYLGIFVTKTFTELFSRNFGLLFDSCKEELARWASLPFSLLGRVNLIKMVILPRFLYPFQHIPLFINKSFFTKLDQAINSFLWCGKRARIRMAVLQLPKSEGGLALPNFRHYYWASNINKILFWSSSSLAGSQPLWAQLEVTTSGLSLWSVVCSQLPILVNQVSKNPLVTNTLKIWSQFRKQFGLHTASGLAPVY